MKIAIDRVVIKVIGELKDEPANRCISEDFWETLAADLSDSRLYYKGEYCFPTYGEAREFAEATIRDWHQHHPVQS